MIVALDATVLLPLLQPGVSVRPPPPGVDPGSAVGRIEHLIGEIDGEGAVALVPAPALSELVMRATETADLLGRLAALRVFRIAPFDERAAIECAIMLSGGRRRTPKAVRTTWAKVRFDHQIVAIAKVRDAVRIYSDDRDVKALGVRAGIEVIGIWDLPPPPEEAEPLLPFPDGGGRTDAMNRPRRAPG